MKPELVHLRVIECGAFTLYDVFCPPHFHLAAKTASEPYACLLIGGSVEERLKDTRRKWRKDSLHFHERGDRHSARVGPEGVRCLSIALTQAKEAQFASYLRAHRRIHPANSDSLVRQAARIQELAERTEPPKPRIEVEAARLFQMVGAAPRQPEKTPTWVDAVRRVLTEHAAAPPTLDDLAQECGIHRAYLCAAFHHHTGATLREFIETQRVNQARDLLGRTTLSIGEIAAELGFCDQSHLNRAFRRQEGKTPLEYRRTNT